MTCRVENGQTFKQDYNTENRISAIHKMNPASGGAGSDCETGTILESWLFGYDGDGVRVSTAHFTGGTADSLSLYYFGGSYEITNGAVKKYYSFAGQTIAMKDANGLQYFLTDHLGSIVAVTDGSGTLTSEQRYLPFGQVRELSNYPTTELTTDFGYTGQRSLGSDLGLMDYRARFYDAYLNRFIQPDSLIPGAENPQSWNRYSYVLNRPINLIDPSGHCGEGSVPSEGVSQEQHDWLCTLREKALELSAKVDAGEIEDDVEALAQLVEFAALHYIIVVRNPRGPGGYTENRSAMAKDLGIVLGGNEFVGTQALIENQGGFLNTLRNILNGELTPGEIARGTNFRCTNTNYSPSNLCQYYTGFNAFQGRGFKEEYREGRGNQVAHFGGGMSALGNMGQPGMRVTIDQEDNPPDKALYEATLDLWRAPIRITEWGNWIRLHLAE